MCSDMRNLIRRKSSHCDLFFMGKTYLRANINLHSIKVCGDDTLLREERVRKCCT